MVYVDFLQNYGWVMYGKKIKSCHLYADDKDELISFAIEIGLKTRYLQKARNGLPHFDLTPRMHHLAITHGAQVIDKKEYRQLINKLTKEKKDD